MALDGMALYVALAAVAFVGLLWWCDAKLKRTEDELSKEEAVSASLREDLESQQRMNEALKQQLGKKEGELQATQGKLDESTARVQQLEQYNKDLEEKKKELEGALAMEKARGRKANVELLRSSTTTPVTSHKTRAGLPNGTPATPLTSITGGTPQEINLKAELRVAHDERNEAETAARELNRQVAECKEALGLAVEDGAWAQHVKDLAERYATAEHDLATAQHQLQAATAQLSAVQVRLEEEAVAAAAAAAVAASTAEQLQQQLAQLRDERDAQAAAAAEQVAATCKQLQAEKETAVQDAINASNTAQTAEKEALLKQHSEACTAHEARVAGLQAAVEQLKGELAQLQAASEKKEEINASLAEQLADSQQQLATEQTDREQLQELIAPLQRKLNDANAEKDRLCHEHESVLATLQLAIDEKEAQLQRMSSRLAWDERRLGHIGSTLAAKHAVLTTNLDVAAEGADEMATLVDKLTERAKELHVNNTALQSQLSDYTVKLNRERSLVIGLQKARDGFRVKCTETEASLTAKKQELATVTEELRRTTQRAQEAETRCAALQQELTQATSHAEGAGSEVEKLQDKVTNFQTALDDSQAELETTIQEYEDAIYILHGEINHYEQIFNKLRNLADQPDAEAAAAALSDVPQLATPPHARATPRVSASASDGGVQGRERVGSEAPVLERRSRALSEDEDANFKALSGHMQTLHKLKQELDQSQSDVKVLNAEVVTLRKQVAEYRGKAHATTDAISGSLLDVEYKRVCQQLETTQSELETVREQLTSAADALRAELAAAEARLADAQREHAAERARLTADAADAERTISDLQAKRATHSNSAAATTTPLLAAPAATAAQDTQTDEPSSTLACIVSTAPTSTGASSTRTVTSTDVTALLQQRDELLAEKEELSKQLETAWKKFIESDITAGVHMIAAQTAESARAAAAARADEAEARVEALQGRVGRVGELEGQVEAARQEIVALRDKVEALTEQLHNAQFLCAEAQAKLTAAEASVIRITKEKDELKQIDDAKFERLATEASLLHSQAEEYKRRVTDAEGFTEDVGTKRKEEHARIGQLEAENDKLSARNAKLKSDIAELQAALASQARSPQRSGQPAVSLRRHSANGAHSPGTSASTKSPAAAAKSPTSARTSSGGNKSGATQVSAGSQGGSQSEATGTTLLQSHASVNVVITRITEIQTDVDKVLEPQSQLYQRVSADLLPALTRPAARGVTDDVTCLMGSPAGSSAAGDGSAQGSPASATESGRTSSRSETRSGGRGGADADGLVMSQAGVQELATGYQSLYKSVEVVKYQLGTLKDYWLSAGDWIPEDQQGKAKAGSEQHSKA